MRALGIEEIRQAVGGQWVGAGPGGVTAGAADSVADVSSARVAGILPARNAGVPARVPFEVGTVTGVSTDTKSIRPGELFVALKGERFDAHAFLPQAAAAGAAAAIVRLGAEGVDAVADFFPGGAIAVADTGKALEQLGAYYRRTLDATVIAVTGSNGKTTVKRMIHHILAKRLRGSCSPKSFNNNIGVPLTLLGADEADQYVVCEVGSNAPGEIAALGAICQPDIAVITSVGRTHLERLGSIEGVAAEKASLLASLRPNAAAITWGDSPVLDIALEPYSCPMVRFGEHARNDLRLTGYESNGLSQRFEVNAQATVNLPLPGRHNASNALSAIAVAMQMGFSLQEAAAAMADFVAVDGRLQAILCGSIQIINDAYNANPTSMLAAADVLAEVTGRRRVMIAGDMREQGPASQDIHRTTGNDMAARKIDLIIGVGELGQYIAAGASGTCETAAFASFDEAMRLAPAKLRDGDMVLLKGSRAMAMERLLDPIRARFATGQRQ